MKRILVTILLLMLITACTKRDNKNTNSINFEKINGSNYTTEEKIEYLLSVMTLEEKVGQMVQVDENGISYRKDVKKFHIGSVLSGGGSDPVNNKPETWANMYDEFQGYALETRLGIPLIYGVDAVHGHNNIYGATIFPHNIGLGATRDETLVEEIARITALEVVGTGIDWTFSPCITVPENEKWGRTYEGYSEDPELVNRLGKAAVRGYQGTDLAAPETILACSKHYVADGGTQNGIDRGNARMKENKLRSTHLYPYYGAVEESVGSIMASFSSWNGEQVHGHNYLLTDLLKGELNYRGFIVSDWDAVTLLPGSYDEQVIKAVNAGVDMIMISGDYITLIESLKRCVKAELISMERIDEAVSLILKAKYDLDLFNKPLTDRSYTGLIGAKEHRAVARDAVRKSMVLLKNENSTLPLTKDLNEIIVAGKNSNDLGAQCGGWTIEWQGVKGNDFTIGTNVLEAVKESVKSHTKVIYSKTGTDIDKRSGTAIVVIGEEAYAEMVGDRKDLKISKEDLNTVKKLKEQGLTVITMLISGRPMILGEVLDYSDAFIAAWLPGTEGLGITDVIFGDYAPTGKLPHTWPLKMSQIPLDMNSSKADQALFPFGFGLTY